MKYVVTKSSVPPTPTARATTWPCSNKSPLRWGWYIEDDELDLVTTADSASPSIKHELNRVTYVVYWTQDGEPKALQVDGIIEMLREAELLRKRARNGEEISHVTSVADELIQVGHAGVDVTGPDYDWKKRRK